MPKETRPLCGDVILEQPEAWKEQSQKDGDFKLPLGLPNREKGTHFVLNWLVQMSNIENSLSKYR